MYALALVGGKGERLRPYTEDRPKGMVEVNGRPILLHHLEWLKQGGVTHVVLLCGYRYQVIRDYFGDGRAFGLHIDYSVEEEPLGRGGAIKQGFQRVPSSEAFVIGTNGDNLNSQPLAPFVQAHLNAGAWVTVLLTQLQSPYGIATLAQDGHIVGFQEKPLLPHWLNAGVYAISREAFPLFPDLGDHEDTTFPELAQRGLLYGFQSTAHWRAIDTVKDLSEASRELKDLS